jgi:hypothetical protein
MAVVSDEHADESLCVVHLESTTEQTGESRRPGPRLISPEEVRRHSGPDGQFWAVIDGFVVDASDFVDSHPGGLRKLLSANNAEAGATGDEFGFSFTRGRNAHFPVSRPMQLGTPVPYHHAFPVAHSLPIHGKNVPGTHSTVRYVQPSSVRAHHF